MRLNIAGAEIRGGQDALAAQAALALERGEEADAIPAIRDGAVRHANPLLWQWTALLQRSLDEHKDALESFEQAARLAPQDRMIAFGHAQTAFEAGVPAIELFQRARRLAPQNGQVLLGWAAALTAQGEGERAVEVLQGALQKSPMWIMGHEQFAQFMATVGRRDEATSSIDDALSKNPSVTELWDALLNIELRRGNYAGLTDVLSRAREAGVESAEFPIYEAIHAAEFDERRYPPSLFTGAPPEISDILDSWRVRHLLRCNAPDEALPILDRGLKGGYAAELWAYAATAWRLTGDPRAKWLEQDGAFVRVFDLDETLPSLSALADHLRSLHVAKGEYLDQSVRGGTQTDGPLFSRIDPRIRALRSAIVKAVEDYVAGLPPVDPSHPLLGHRRNRRIRFSGSWSVRLRSGGRHANHVHPRGWISSAFYVALPGTQPGEPNDAGWLTLGEPDEKLAPTLPPSSKVEPRPGRLVLFPSWAWHGTQPFAEGERLTVAFDVRPPV